MKKPSTLLTVRGSLATAQNIMGDAVGNSRKAVFQRDSRAFLKSLAVALKLDSDRYSIRANSAGPAISGEVTLHADHLYVQLSEFRVGVEILYRSCKSRRDYTGGQNHFETIRALTEADRQERFVTTCRQLYDHALQEAVSKAA